MTPIGLLLHTDRRHGVARYARELATAVAGPSCVAIPERSWAARSWTASSAIDRVHVQFTDRLWGPTPEAACRRLLEVAGSRRLSVTLHDLPQPSDGTGFARRSEAYARVVDAADTVIVNSRHEQALLRNFHPGSPVPSVIPLPVHPARAPVRTVLEPVCAVLGYVYPGKGHREVITAIAHGGTGLAFRALGAPSVGHERDADDLVRLGQELGVDVAITGYLTDRRLRAAASIAAVPVVAHQHLSASGSINSWISAGRRPIAVRSRYTEEMEALRPGTLRLTTADDLPAAIGDAVDDPGSTMLGPDPLTRPHLEDTASAYVELWRRTAAACRTR